MKNANEKRTNEYTTQTYSNHLNSFKVTNDNLTKNDLIVSAKDLLEHILKLKFSSENGKLLDQIHDKRSMEQFLRIAENMSELEKLTILDDKIKEYEDLFEKFRKEKIGVFTGNVVQDLLDLESLLKQKILNPLANEYHVFTHHEPKYDRSIMIEGKTTYSIKYTMDQLEKREKIEKDNIHALKEIIQQEIYANQPRNKLLGKLLKREDNRTKAIDDLKNYLENRSRFNPIDDMAELKAKIEAIRKDSAAKHKKPFLGGFFKVQLHAKSKLENGAENVLKILNHLNATPQAMVKDTIASTELERRTIQPRIRFGRKGNIE